MLLTCYSVQRYEKVGQSESESEWSKDEKKEGYSQDEGETDIEQSQVCIMTRHFRLFQYSSTIGILIVVFLLV